MKQFRTKRFPGKRLSVKHISEGHFFRKSALLLLALFLAVSLLPASVFAEDEEEVSAADWMGQLSDSEMLSEVTIPGTNNSMARYIFPGAALKCQGKSFEKQMEEGYRFFDIGLGIDEKKKDTKDDDRLICRYRTGACRKGMSWFSGAITFEDTLQKAYAFLDKHQTETLLFLVKDEDEKKPEEFSKLFFDAVNENTDRWYLDNAIPALGQARGKIVLCNRFSSGSDTAVGGNGLYFSWEPQDNREVVDLPYTQSVISGNEKLWVQDRYRYNVAQKWDAVTDTFENCQADEETISLNFVSTRGSSSFGSHRYYSYRLNQKLNDYDLTVGTSYGIVVVDYGTAKIARHIFEVNL